VGVEKQQQVEKLLTDILTLMQFPARLDFKDAADGSLAVAMHFTGETPQGITAGKKSYLVDSLQFLLNKCINRPNTERRWVLLGVGGFPEPRGAKPVAAPAPSAPMPATNGSAPAGARRPPRAEMKSAPGKAPVRASEVDESKLEVAEDPALSALGKMLAEKSARLGRHYAVAMMTTEDRARLLKAAKAVAGVNARVEGEAHFRRLAFVPDKPTPMPKRHAMALYPDDEDEGE
jgi:predicted RNA-binding protein Jag